MTRFWNVIIQLVLAGGQIVNLLEPIIKPEHKIYAMTIISVLQVVVSIVAHEFNPDGSSAKTAYNGETLI